MRRRRRNAGVLSSQSDAAENGAGENAKVFHLLGFNVCGGFFENGSDDRKVVVRLVRLMLLQDVQGAQQFLGAASDQGKRLTGYQKARDDFDFLLRQYLKNRLHVVLAQRWELDRGCSRTPGLRSCVAMSRASSGRW